MFRCPLSSERVTKCNGECCVRSSARWRPIDVQICNMHARRRTRIVDSTPILSHIIAHLTTVFRIVFDFIVGAHSVCCAFDSHIRLRHLRYLIPYANRSFVYRHSMQCNRAANLFGFFGSVMSKQVRTLPSFDFAIGNPTCVD